MRDRAPRVVEWDLEVCSQCRNANHEGIVPGRYALLEVHLKAHGIVPELNAKRFYKWPMR